MFTCYLPTRARFSAAQTLAAVLQREPSSDFPRRLESSRRRETPDELLTLEAALLLNGDATKADLTSEVTWRRFPNHPRVRLAHCRPLSNQGEWSEVYKILTTTDPSGLDEGELRHYHHMLGFCLLMFGDPVASLSALIRSTNHSGRCDLTEPLALVTPLEEGPASIRVNAGGDPPIDWDPIQRALREFLSVLAAADAAFARGAVSLARHRLDCLLVWEAYDIQGFARLAEAYMLEEQEGADVDRYRMGFILLAYCELFANRGGLGCREVILPRGAWNGERLAGVAARARERAEALLSGPLP